MIKTRLFDNNSSKFLLIIGLIAGFILVFEYAWDLTWFYLVCVVTLIASIYVANSVNPTASEEQFKTGSKIRKVICPSCGSENVEDSVYCSNCGSHFKDNASAKQIANFCTNCGSENTNDAAYCSNCGNRLNIATN